MERFIGEHIDVIVGIAARRTSERNGGFIPVRKPGKHAAKVDT